MCTHFWIGQKLVSKTKPFNRMFLSFFLLQTHIYLTILFIPFEMESFREEWLKSLTMKKLSYSWIHELPIGIKEKF